VNAGGVIDVTSYPDISELFLVADALITDYSSVMFDFSVTGKPIFFFTPDLDRYQEVLRGF
jgi:CDP-glycerol glycerophosphotransferase